MEGDSDPDFKPLPYRAHATRNQSRHDGTRTPNIKSPARPLLTPSKSSSRVSHNLSPCSRPTPSGSKAPPSDTDSGARSPALFSSPAPRRSRRRLGLNDSPRSSRYGSVECIVIDDEGEADRPAKRRPRSTVEVKVEQRAGDDDLGACLIQSQSTGSSSSDSSVFVEATPELCPQDAALWSDLSRFSTLGESPLPSEAFDAADSDYDSPDNYSVLGNTKAAVPNSQDVACPLCARLFPATRIENHASTCCLDDATDEDAELACASLWQEPAAARSIPPQLTNDEQAVISQVSHTTQLTSRAKAEQIVQTLLAPLEPLPTVNNPFVPARQAVSTTTTPARRKPPTLPTTSTTQGVHMTGRIAKFHRNVVSFCSPRFKIPLSHPAAASIRDLPSPPSILRPVVSETIPPSLQPPPPLGPSATVDDDEFVFDFDRDGPLLSQAPVSSPPQASRPEVFTHPDNDDIVETQFTQDPAARALALHTHDEQLLPTIPSSPSEGPIIPAWLQAGYYARQFGEAGLDSKAEPDCANDASDGDPLGTELAGSVGEVNDDTDGYSSPIEGFVNIHQQASTNPDLANYLQQFDPRAKRQTGTRKESTAAKGGKGTATASGRGKARSRASKVKPTRLARRGTAASSRAASKAPASQPEGVPELPMPVDPILHTGVKRKIRGDIGGSFLRDPPLPSPPPATTRSDGSASTARGRRRTAATGSGTGRASRGRRAVAAGGQRTNRRTIGRPAAARTAPSAVASRGETYAPGFNFYDPAADLGIDGGDTLWEYRGGSTYG
ncbi:hypothetical protein IWQ60_001185 [Tieghemiomyces parasiticus]|uniref:Uncharacterized protein n=1 Tax=Tieghemiomyces parasiticus TaxID=78921 RepID=A0A9W8ALJ9_9FUNG|nr:hypothetical protein IWQ60_001185 [Tieghemiomyces parasiticus]